MIINTRRIKRKRFNPARRHKEAFKRAKSLKKRMTIPELNVKKALDDLGIKHIPQHVYFYTNANYRIVDFYLPDLKLNLEVDGDSHDSPKAKAYDKRKDALSKNKTIRIPNIYSYKENLKRLLLDMLKKASSPNLNLNHKTRIHKTAFNPFNGFSRYRIKSQPKPLINSCKGLNLAQMQHLGLL